MGEIPILVDRLSPSHNDGSWHLHEVGGSKKHHSVDVHFPDSCQFKKKPTIVLSVVAVHGDGHERGGETKHCPFGFSVSASHVTKGGFRLTVSRLDGTVPLWGISVQYMAFVGGI